MAQNHSLPERNNIPERILKAFEGLNLTQYEISLYWTLINDGPLNAKDLSDKSGVPYSRIYNILALLLDKGFVTRDDTHRPSIFVANPPDEALMLARKKFIDDYNEHSKIIVQELNDIYLKKVDAPFSLNLLVYRGKDAVFTKAKHVAEEATQSILVATNAIEDLASIGFIDILREKQSKENAEVKILLERSQHDHPLVKELVKLGEVRERDQIFGTGIVKDGVDAIIILKVKVFTLETYFGLKSEHEAFGPVAVHYFQYLYDSATRIN